MTVSLPDNYRPSADEEFMNPRQLEYFRQKLLRWRSDLVRVLQGSAALLDEGRTEGDQADQASAETDREFEVINRERARGLISRIDLALGRIENGTYGYCEETDEPISLRRLEAQPIATLSIEAQERQERARQQMRGD
jgi:DnaK suppressor protein